MKNFIMMSAVFLMFQGLAYAEATVSVTPSTHTVPAGQTFDMYITVDPNGTGTSAAQFNFYFDTNVVTVNSVTQGNFYSQGGASTLFNQGTINNVTGRVINTWVLIITPGAYVTTPGVMAIISLTAAGSAGWSNLSLGNVILSDTNSVAIPNLLFSSTVTVTDITPPADITGLSIFSIGSDSVTLTWAAPGDDGNTGTASEYDLRYLTSPITEGNWASAVQVSGEPLPLQSGNAQSMTVAGLSSSTNYYFAIKTLDEIPNTSALSNVVSCQTLLPSPPAAPEVNKEIVYPNPYVKGKSTNEKINFGNLPAESTLRIYAISGEHVKTIKHEQASAGGTEEWDISGIPGGIYLYTIISSEGVRKGKISIIK